MAKAYLEQWLSSPENFVTKENVKEAREKLKAAKRGGGGGGGGAAADPDAATRQQVRSLAARWGALKREQRGARREARRRKRAHRRAEKRGRRQARREAKRARRQARREGRQAQREARREDKRGGGGGHRGGRRHDHGPGHDPHGGAGPFGARARGWFPGAGHGPGARGRGPFPFFGGRGGGPPAVPVPGGPGPHADFQRGVEDWSRRMDGWGRDFSAWGGGPGAWPSGSAGEHDVKGGHVHGDEYGGGEQEAGIAMRDDEGGDGAHAVSGAMYAALEEKQRELQGKRDALAGLQENSYGEDSNGKKEGAPMSVVLLPEIAELEVVVKSLTLKADEQFAKELSALEG